MASARKSNTLNNTFGLWEKVMQMQSRRRFVKNSSSAAISATVSSFLPEPALGQPLGRTAGIQLYTVLKELDGDLAGTLRKIASMGYNIVESAGFGGKSPQEFRKALDGAGLVCSSSHLFMATSQNIGGYLDAINTIGSTYAVTSIMAPLEASVKTVDDYLSFIRALTQDSYKRMVDSIHTLAMLTKSAGLQLAYHNHNMEFKRWPDGATGFDILMAGLDPSLLKVELDCGWAELAGYSPATLLRRYSGRIKMLHVKDFAAVPHPITELTTEGSGPNWTLLGNGHLNYGSILTAAFHSGVEQIFVEQEPPYVAFTALEAAKANLNYLKSLA